MNDSLAVVNAFVSYSNADRVIGAEVKAALGAVGIETFLAHDDLQVSETWQRRILQELRRCDLFIPILSEHFVESNWAPQEAGFIASRPEVVIAPLSIDGTIPYGFFSHIQSTSVGDEGVTYENLVEPLLTPLTEAVPRKMLPTLIRRAANAGSFRQAEFLMRPLVPFFPLLTNSEARALAEAAVRNAQIWSAGECRTVHLPAFVREHKDNIEPETLHMLKFQIENDKRYIPSPEEMARDAFARFWSRSS